MKINETRVRLKNDQELTLRSATANDAETMLRHLVITHTESYKNMNQTSEYWENFSLDVEKKILSDFEVSDAKFMLIATSDHDVVGGLGFVGSQSMFHRKTGTIGMSIQEELTNLGLGTAMMRVALETAKSGGFHRAELTVRTYNDAGIALYEKTGFRRVGKLSDAALFDGRYVDEFIYELLLESDDAQRH